MGKTKDGRFAAAIEGDFVVFLIGVRMNKWWKPHLWLHVALGIWPMLGSLRKRKEANGFLGYELIYLRGFGFIQYWRSFEDLDRYATDKNDRHMGMWSWFNKKVAASGDLGIWHETYLVKAGNYEAVYGNMPLMGLAKCSALVPMAQKGQSAPKRLGLTESDEVAHPYY